MGCSVQDKECRKDEKPGYQVTFTEGFWIGQTEVTEDAYRRVAQAASLTCYRPGGNMFAELVCPPLPPKLSGSKLPMAGLTLENAEGYCSAVKGSVPSEEQWEYAARAGNRDARYGDLSAIAWYSGNSAGNTHEVGQKSPNAWGLFDMLGNVAEWTEDNYTSRLALVQPKESVKTGRNVEENLAILQKLDREAHGEFGPWHFSPKILRGGGYTSPGRALRFSYRSDAFDPMRMLVFAGVRCVQPASGTSIPDPAFSPRPKGR